MSHLTDASGRRVQSFGIGSLDRIDDEIGWMDLFQRDKDSLEACLGKHEEIVSSLAEAIGAHFYLLGRLFAGNVEDASAFLLQVPGYLEEQRRFSYTRFSSKQD